MSNNYSQTAFTLIAATPEQARTLAKWLLGDDLPDELIALLKDTDADAFDDEGELEYTIADQAEADGAAVYVAVEDSGDFELITTVLDYALKTWSDMPSPQGFQWAFWGDAMRTDEYGGGAVIVARDAEPRWFGTSEWLREQLGASQA